jgi:hypothetical protein
MIKASVPAPGISVLGNFCLSLLKTQLMQQLFPASFTGYSLYQVTE